MGELDGFLARHAPIYEETSVWGGGTVPLRVRWYLGEAQPPFEYVTSIRCMVLRGDTVLVMRNRDGRHIWPGGRREPGEIPAQTLARAAVQTALH